MINLSLEEALMKEGFIITSFKGTSMNPLFLEGRDKVYIVKKTSKLKRGDVALYKRSNGQFVLHRVIKVCTDEYLMCGDNQAIPESGITDSQIIAVVSKFKINGILYSKDSKKLILRVKVKFAYALNVK